MESLTSIGYLARPDSHGEAAERALRDLAEVLGDDLLRVIVNGEDWQQPLDARFGLLNATETVASGEAATLITDYESLQQASTEEIAALYARIVASGGDLKIVSLFVNSIPAQRDGSAVETS